MEKKNVFMTIIAIVVVIGVFILGFFVGGDNSKSTNNVNKDNAVIESSDNVEQILSNAQKESESIKESEMEELENISVSEYLEEMNESDPEIIYVARPTCSYCQVAEPIIRKIAEDYDLDIHYLNTDEFDNEDTSKFVGSDDSFAEGFGTPMVLIIGNGKLIDKVDGLTDTQHYVQLFKNNGFIK